MLASLAAVLIMLGAFWALPLLIVRAMARSDNARRTWPESRLTVTRGGRGGLGAVREARVDASVAVRRFASGYPWSISIVAAPLAMLAFIWAIAGLFEGTEFVSAARHREFAWPLLLALAACVVRALGATATSVGALERDVSLVRGGVVVSVLVDLAVATLVQISDSRSGDRAVAAVGLALTSLVALTFAIEHARRRDVDVRE
jgi:hypothetical protein